MSVRKIHFSLQEFYHLYNRGVEKRTIFLDNSDYKRFIELLYLANSSRAIDMRSIYENFHSIYEWERDAPLVSIGAYCLMPNHFHVLLTPLIDNGVTVFMGKLGTSYSMYFNSKYNRTGTLFQGKFKAQWAESDQYHKYLFSYIHLNPIKLIQKDWKEQGIQDPQKALVYAKAYKYSSLQDYTTEHSRVERLILDKAAFPDYFPTGAQNEAELLQWLTYKPVEINQ